MNEFRQKSMKHNSTFSVIYSFKVKDGNAAEFIIVWESLTKIIYQYAGSLGSHLFQSENGVFIAHAYWPNKELWQNADSNLPAEAEEYRTQMKELCSEIKTEYKLTSIVDLTKLNV